jgi:hypothetical protein
MFAIIPAAIGANLDMDRQLSGLRAVLSFRYGHLFASNVVNEDNQQMRMGAPAALFNKGGFD